MIVILGSERKAPWEPRSFTEPESTSKTHYNGIFSHLC